MPTSDHIDHLLDEAAECGRRADLARQSAEQEYVARREAVARCRAAGASYGQIADRLRVSRSHVQAILRQA